MKKLLSLMSAAAVICALSIVPAFAMEAGMKDNATMKEHMEKDGKMMKEDGKMMEKDGKMMKEDGTMMEKDGKMMEKDGKMMKEGAKEGM